MSAGADADIRAIEEQRVSFLIIFQIILVENTPHKNKRWLRKRKTTKYSGLVD